eukprot:1171935-Amphidinium_carterae.1
MESLESFSYFFGSIRWRQVCGNLGSRRMTLPTLLARTTPDCPPLRTKLFSGTLGTTTGNSCE